MDKPNVFRTSEFYMSEGDILHVEFIEETGDDLVIELTPIADGIPVDGTPPDIYALPASSVEQESFTANWNGSPVADGYILAVSYSIDMLTPHPNYDDIDVGDVTSLSVDVTGDAGVIFYYRVKAYNDNGDGAWSPVIATGAIVSDWYLPSQDALGFMQTSLYDMSIGNLLTDFYWSSSENDASSSWGRVFTTSAQSTALKNTSSRIRPIRSFAGGVGDYAMGDSGPGGGWIFAYEGGVYYEAAPIDTASTVWSNVDSVLLGSTSLNIEEGQNNTSEIIGQVGHTGSAAKACDDFTSVIPL